MLMQSGPLIINIPWLNNVGSHGSLKAMAIDVVPLSQRGGDDLECLLHRKACWIFEIKLRRIQVK